jgi:hypothetical protein
VTVKASTGFTPISYTTSRPLDPRDEYGGIGDGASHPLSSVYGSLAAAQVRYPHATALTDEIDWCAIQGVINASMTSGAQATTIRKGTRDVLVPSGSWVLNQPLTVASVEDFKFVGMGPTTKFRLGGVGVTAMLDLNGTAYGSFGHFSFADTLLPAFHTCTRALWVRYDSATSARSSAFNSFRNITVRGINYTDAGVQIGMPGSGGQEDNTAWEHILVNGDGRWHTSTGTSTNAVSFYVGSGVNANNLIHTFNGCAALANRYGLYVPSTQAFWYGGSIQTMWEADIFVSSAGPVIVDGVRSETSARLLRTGGPAGFNATVQISNYKYEAISASLASDKRLIDWQIGGSLVLTNVAANNPGNDPLVIYSNPLSPTVITSTGVSIARRTLTQAYSVSPNTTNRVVAYVNVDASGGSTGVESNLSASATVTITGNGTATTFTATHNLALASPFIPASVAILHPDGSLLPQGAVTIDTLTANSFRVLFASAPLVSETYMIRIGA